MIPATSCQVTTPNLQIFPFETPGIVDPSLLSVSQFSCSVMSNSLWPCGPFESPWTSRSITNSQSTLNSSPLNQSYHLIFYHPLLLLPSIFPSIRVFSNKSVLCLRWQKYWSFSFSISPSSEYSGLISFRIDWFDLFAVQGTLKSLLQR